MTLITSIINWLKTSFMDADGKPSAKRITLCIALLMMVQMGIGQQYWSFVAPEHIYDSFSYIVISGTGAVLAEKYFSLKKGNQETPKQ